MYDSAGTEPTLPFVLWDGQIHVYQNAEIFIVEKTSLDIQIESGCFYTGHAQRQSLTLYLQTSSSTREFAPGKAGLDLH